MADLKKIKIGGTEYLIKDDTARTEINNINASKGAANGIAQLDANSKIPVAQLPDVILGQLVFGGPCEYKKLTSEATEEHVYAYPTSALQKRLGIHDDTIQLVDSDTDDKTTTPKKYGYKTLESVYFIARNSFTIGSTTFQIGDWLLGVGTYWDIIENVDTVKSVNEKTGNVVLQGSDIQVSTSNTDKIDVALGKKQNIISAGTANNIMAFSGTDGTISSLERTTSISDAATDGQIPTAAAVKNYHDATKQDKIDDSHKLSADLISDGTTNKAYTGTEQTKLGGIAAGAQVNVIEKIKLNGTDLTPDSEKRIDLGNIATSESVVASVSYVDASHKLQQTKGTTTTDVHTFGSFADVSKGKGSIETADSATLTYTPSGSVTVGHTSTSMTSTGSVTAKGSVTGTVVPSGTVSVTLNNNVVNSITNAGSQASLTYAASDSFCKEGIKAHMGDSTKSEDAECLYFEEVTDKGTASVISGWTANTIPTFEEKTVGVASSTFTGNASGDTITATFTGTAVDVSVSGNYDKANASATFTGTAAAGTEVSLTKTSKDIEVTPEA